MAPKKVIDLDRLCALLSIGVSMSAACAKVGITVASVYAWMRSDDPRGERVKAAIADAEITRLDHIRNSGRDDWRSSAWYLEKRVAAYRDPSKVTAEHRRQVLGEIIQIIGDRCDPEVAEAVASALDAYGRELALEADPDESGTSEA